LDFNDLLEYLKKKRYAWVAGAIITIPVNVALTLIPTCLTQIIVGAVSFGILFLFGIRSLRKFFLIGLVIFIITGILFGAFYTNFLYNREYIFEPKDLGNSYLSNGTVNPYQGDLDTRYNYSVTYTGEEDPQNVTILVNLSDSSETQFLSLLLEDHKDLYYNKTALGDDIYSYHFSIYLKNKDKWVRTDEAQGPLTIPYYDMMGIQMFIGFGYVILNGGLVFFLAVGLYHWKITEGKRKNKDENVGA
jgi:energy-coupling factor transporter transmembrane protein EcfT